jgi:hypothetical protein
MRNLLLGAVAGALLACAAVPFAEAQLYIYGGRHYCGYNDGWRGPGYYWCGYAWRRGFGWGGGWGWHGWGGGNRHGGGHFHGGHGGHGGGGHHGGGHHR